MKNLKTIAIALLIAAGTFSANAQEKKVDIDNSRINWVGKKVTGQHEGTISLKSGVLIFKKAKLVGGNFVADMNSIQVTDLEAGKGKEKLEGHLKADDFFGVEQHQTAKLVIKKIDEKSKGLYRATGDLTIKGITNSVNFDISVGKDMVTTSFNVDRTKFGIKYKSKNFFEGLGDNVISDEFELTANLKF